MKKTPRIFNSVLFIAVAVSAVFGMHNVHAAETDITELEISGQTMPEQEIINPDTYTEDLEYPEDSLEYIPGIVSNETGLTGSGSGLAFGAGGRLYSEDIGIDVEVKYYDMFSKENSNAEAQRIVDGPDTAIWMDYHINTIVIGDHYNQGFEAIKQSVPGETTLYMTSEDGTQKYICQNVQKGHNDGETILAEDGTDLLVADPGGLLLYTCDGNWRNIFIAQYTIAAE